MTTPTLALGISAGGATAVADLAAAVGRLGTNLQALKATAGNTGGFAGLDALNEQIKGMRQDLGQALAGIRTELADGFSKAYTKAATEVKAGGEKVEREAKAAAVKIRLAAKGMGFGDGLSMSASATGIGSAAALKEMQTSMSKNVEVIKYGLEQSSKEWAKAGALQKSQWVDYLKELHTRLESEKTMMNDAVAKFRAIQQTRLQAEIANDEKLKAQWVSYTQELAKRLAQERTMMDGAVAQFKAIQADRLQDQIAHEAKQRTLWLNHTQELAERLLKERTMMDGAVAQFKAIQADRLQAEIASEAKQKALWLNHTQELAERLKKEQFMMEGAVAKFKALQTEKLAIIARGYMGQSMSAPQAIGEGSYSSIGNNYGQLRQLPTALEDTGKKAAGASAQLKGMTSALNDGHSAARGLASGFGAMWLTWGNIAPLLAGAAISHAVAKTFSIGSEVSYNIKFMELMSGATVEASTVIRDALRQINEDTKFTLVELTKAFVNLGQAGKTPAESLQMLKPIADLATVGMTDLDTATKLVIQAQALFGLKTEDTGKLVSQLYLTTKSGTINIEDLGGSFKYASEANTRFGISVEETLTVLKSLGQAGIKASSGGTAFINFLRDVHGRSGPAVAAMKELEKSSGQAINLWTNENGQKKMRGVIDIFKDIAAAASKLDPEYADKLLGKLTSDRGGRTYFAMIRDGTIDLEKMRGALQDVNKELAAQDAMTLNKKTVQGNFEILKSALGNTMDTVFTKFEAGIMETLQKLQVFAKSSGFESFIAGAVGSVLALVNALIALKDPIILIAELWLGWKVLSGVTLLLNGLSIGLTNYAAKNIAAAATTAGATSAMAAQGAATLALATEQRVLALGMDASAAATVRQGVAATAATGPMRGLAIATAFLTHPLVGLVSTLAILGTTWWTFSNAAGDATQTLTQKIIVNGNLNIEQFDKEIKKLRERNALMGVKPDTYAELDGVVAQAKKAESATAARMATINSSPYAKSAANVAEMTRLEAQYSKQVNATNAAIKSVSEARDQDATAATAKQAAQDAKIRAAMNPTGPLATAPEGGGRGGKKGKSAEDTRVHYDNELRIIQEAFQKETSSAKLHNDNELKLLDARHKAGIIGEGTYQAELLNLTMTYEAAQAQALESNLDKYTEAWSDRKVALQTSGMPPKALEQALENLDNEWTKFYTGYATGLDNLDSNAYTRQQLGVIGLEKEINTLNKTSEQYWLKAEASALKEAAAASTRHEFANATEEVRARMEAESKVAETHTVFITNLAAEYKKAQEDLSQFNVKMSELGLQGPEVDAVLDDMTKKVSTLGTKLEESGTRLSRLKQIAGDSAVTEVSNKRDAELRKDAKKLSDDIAGGLADSIISGGKKGVSGLKETVKAAFMQPIKVMLQAVLQPLGNMVANAAYSFLGLNNATGGGNSLMSMVSNGSSLNSMYNMWNGGASGMFSTPGVVNMGGTQMATGAGLNGFLNGTGGGATALAESYGALEAGVMVEGVGGTAGAASGAGFAGMGAAAGAAAAIAVIAYVAAEAYKSTRGEERGGGRYDLDLATGKSSYTNGPNGSRGEGADELVNGMVETATTSLNAAFKSWGSAMTVTAMTAAYETSAEARGGVFSGGMLSNGLRFGEDGSGSNYDWSSPYNSKYEMWDPSLGGSIDGNAKFHQWDMNGDPAKLAVDMQQSFIAAIQASVGIIPRIVEEKYTFEGGDRANVDAAGVYHDQEQLIGTKWHRVYDKAMIDSAEALGGLPKSIFKLIKNVDPEGLSAEATQSLVGKIATIVANVNGFRAAMEQMPLGKLKEASFDVAATIVELSGGLEKFAANMLTYVDNFYTADEKRRFAANQISAQLKTAGVNVSADQVLGVTRAQFRAILEQFTEMGEAGAPTVAALLAVAGGIASLTEAADSSATSITALSEKVDTARQNMIQAYQDEASILEATVTRFRDFAKQIRDFRDSLLLGDKSPLTPEQKYNEALRQFNQVNLDTQSTDPLKREEAMGKLQSVSEAFLETSRMFFASSDQYTSDFAMVQGVLTRTATAADATADVAKLQLDYIKSQLSVLGVIDSSTNMIAVRMAELISAVKDLARGSTPGSWTSTSNGSSYTSTGGATAVQTNGGGTTVYGASGGMFTPQQIISYVNQQLVANNPMAVYEGFKQIGMTMAEANKVMNWPATTMESWAQANNLPVYHSGVSSVPSTGLALLEQGERVVSAPDNSTLIAHLQREGTGENTQGLQKAIASLQAEVRMLREDNNQGHGMNAQATMQNTQVISGSVKETAVQTASMMKSKKASEIV
jgi:hypothetical protein